MAKYRAIKQWSTWRLQDCTIALIYYRLDLEEPVYFEVYCNVTYLFHTRVVTLCGILRIPVINVAIDSKACWLLQLLLHTNVSRSAMRSIESGQSCSRILLKTSSINVRCICPPLCHAPIKRPSRLNLGDLSR